MDKKIFKVKELLIILPLLAAAVIMWAVFSLAPKGERAVIELNGEVIGSYELRSLTEPAQLELQGENGIELSLEISAEGARFISSGCPDKTCVRTGLVSKAGEAAVCLPARVAIRIEGESGLDGVTY